MTAIDSTCLSQHERKRQHEQKRSVSGVASLPTPLRRWIYRVIVVCLVFLVCELQLQLLAWCFPTVRNALLPPHVQSSLAAVGPGLLSPDALLGVRGNPAHPDHDRFGFRNTTVPKHPTIIAIGDSQTHGLIQAAKTWPAAHERATGITTYNMGIAGWGPAEYLLMLDAALQRKPKVIVVGLYLGNDIADAYRSVVLRGASCELSEVAIPTRSDDGISEDLWNAENRKLFRTPSIPQPKKGGGGLAHRFRAVLSDHCRLYGVARGFKNTIAFHLEKVKSAGEQRDEEWARTVQWSKRHPQTSILQVDQLRTVLTSAYRGALLDTTDPRIEAGFTLTLEAIGRMADRCQARNVELVVAIIPTKEWVFDAVVTARNMHPGLAELMTYEAAARDGIVSYLNRNEISFVDTGPALRECVREGRQPYPMSTDGHPNAVGNEAIAKAIAKRTRSSASQRITRR